MQRYFIIHHQTKPALKRREMVSFPELEDAKKYMKDFNFCKVENWDVFKLELVDMNNGVTLQTKTIPQYKGWQ